MMTAARPVESGLAGPGELDRYPYAEAPAGWEYAGMGDVFFDLANFSVNHELDEADRELLLEAYFGAARPAAAVGSTANSSSNWAR